MANIFDYLDWRGDIPFSVDPFNDVDNLVLSELVYVDFSGILDEASDFSIERVCEAFWNKYTEEDVKARPEFTRMAAFLLKRMAGSRRYGGMRLKYFIDILSMEKEEQVAAVTFVLPDGSVYLAYRGTDSSIVGWKEDLIFSYQTGTAGQKTSVEYLNRHFAEGSPVYELGREIGNYASCDDVPLRLGGHSKGGNFAVYAAINTETWIADRIQRIYSNDAPGFKQEVVDSDAYQKLLPKITSIIPENSMIGVLMHNEYDHIVVKSSNKGIMQHDGLSWQVMRNHFEELDQRGDDSLFVEAVLNNWLSGIPDEEREEFIDSLFSFLEGTGKTKFSEVMDDRKSIDFMFEHLKTMDGDRRKLLTGVISKFFQSTGEVLQQDLKARWETLKLGIMNSDRAKIEEKMTDKGETTDVSV